MAKKAPSFQWYPGDWMKDPAVRSVSLAARGLWADMLCLMHESDRRGYLQHTSGKPVTAEQLARMTGCSTDEVSRLLQELGDSGVYSRTDDGVIYSRRMVRDEKDRIAFQKAGRLGGNPALRGNYNDAGFVYLLRRPNGDVKIGISKSPENRLKKIRASCRDSDIVLYAKLLVEDMGSEEKLLHDRYGNNRIDGEWFRISDCELNDLKKEWTLKGTNKGPPKGPLKMKEKKKDLWDLNQKKDGAAPPFFELIPEILRVPKFLEAWKTWIDYRKKRKPPYTEEAAKRALPKLAGEGVESSVERIDRSIINGWQGLFFNGESGGGAYRGVNGNGASKRDQQMQIIDQAFSEK